MYKIRIYVLNYNDDVDSISLSKLCGDTIRDNLLQNHENLEILSISTKNGRKDISGLMRELLTLEAHVIKITLCILKRGESSSVFGMLTNSISNNLQACIDEPECASKRLDKHKVQELLTPIIERYNMLLDASKIPMLKQFEVCMRTAKILSDKSDTDVKNKTGYRN